MSKNEQKRVSTTKKRAKHTNSFICKICDYNTSRHSNYLRHIETKKHLEKHKKVLFSVKSVNKHNTFIDKPLVYLSELSKHNDMNKTKKGNQGKFYCELCNYKASQKSHYEKHLKTKKHMTKVSFFSGHKNNKSMYTSTDTTKVVQDTSSKILKDDKTIEIDKLKKQIYSIIENQNLIKKETDDIKMKSKQGQVIYNNNISINFFLDTYCSKAQPIQDFISNMSFKLGDIMRNNELVENFISKKLLKGLEEMPVTERPIHCTDQKRKNFIVKDERQGWVKDTATDNSSKLYTRVNQLHKKAYIDFYNEYDKENPLPHDGDKEQIKFNISSQIINQNDDINKCIIRDIAKQVDIYDALGDVKGSMLENNTLHASTQKTNKEETYQSSQHDYPFTENQEHLSTPNINVICSSSKKIIKSDIDNVVLGENNVNNTNIKFSINITDNE